MEMTLRWYGSKFDTVTLKQIRQIPGVTGVITTLYDTAPGEVWSRERIKEMKDEVEKSGLHVSGIESVNVHDAIKSEHRTEISTLTIILKRLEISEKRTFILYAITLCLYSTGQEANLQENVQTVQPCLHTIKMILIKLFPRRCLNLFQRI